MLLPVLQPGSAVPASLATRVGGRAELRFGRHERMLYATDASMYQVEPLGVVVPRTVGVLPDLMEWAFENTVAVLARSGGTSLAGQCTARAVVVDVSAHLRSIDAVEWVVDGAAGCATVWVDAGCALDEVNAELTRRGLGVFFPPDPATSAQACVGGCIGNNASGSRSIKYGRTVDSVLAIDAVTSSGRVVRFGPGAGRRDPAALKLADGVARIVRSHAGLIRERFPRTLRRNAGYAVDLVLDQLERGVSESDLDLVPLLAGSEGTLALTARAQLKLWPLPRAKGLVLASFASVDEAIDSVVPLLATGVSAVELVDDVVIEAAMHNIECRRYVGAFPTVGGAAPRAVLYIEYHEGSGESLDERFEACARVLPSGTPHRRVVNAAEMADAWKLRKAGEPLLHGLPGSRKPLTFVEDNAVPPARLGEFVREFRRIVEGEGTRAAFWAHASVGVLHVRPLLDPHDPGDLKRLERIAVAAADLAKRCGGVMSGEHGDGKVRGPLLERFYGPELMGAFREIKRLFDPRGILNPGNIVDAGPIGSIVERTRIAPVADRPAPVVPPVRTYFDYSDHHGFEGAVERCNGAGVCRKQSGGTMCPSYRATADERHSTRGRGNALRLAITGQFSADGVPNWQDAETRETLDLCLSCKACKAECPSNVDIARLKAEYTARGYDEAGVVPLEALAVGHVRLLGQAASLAPGLVNAVAESGPAKWLARRVLGLDPRRKLPRFERSLMSRWESEGVADDRPTVALFGDCFTMYNEPGIGLSARRVLERCGYRVVLAAGGCCGRSMISVGMLAEAVSAVDRTIESMLPLVESDAVQAMVFVEPSCLSAVKDDWLSLRCRTPLETRCRIAEKSWLVEQFLEMQWEKHPRALRVTGVPARTALHAHCHQRALWGASSSADVLKRLVPDLVTLNTGCCGMAGSFGYRAKTSDLSLRIANLPAHQGGVVRSLEEARPVRTCATGTSCRHQIADATCGAVRPIHPIELIDELTG